MADVTLNTRIILRNDTSGNWVSQNPVLLKGEIGLETNTGRFKIGDGISEWNDVKYASDDPAIVSTANPTNSDYDYKVGSIWVNSTTGKAYILYSNATNNAIWKQVVTPDDLSDLGAGDMLKAQFATNAKNTQGYVDKAILSDTATRLVSGRTFALSGDASGVSNAFDGSANVAIGVTLADSGITAGTYTKVTFDRKGRGTSGGALSATDIPVLTLAKISDAGTAASKDVGSGAGNVPMLDSNGKIDTNLLPSIAITNVHVVNSQEEMLALEATVGDIAARTDTGVTYILKDEPASVGDNWIQLPFPTDAVQSVNGKVGIVTLETSDVPEGTNLYFTEARATANFDTNIARTSVKTLSDGNTVLLSTDTYILDGGNA